MVGVVLEWRFDKALIALCHRRGVNPWGVFPGKALRRQFGRSIKQGGFFPHHRPLVGHVLRVLSRSSLLVVMGKTETGATPSIKP